jgi:hypothetical protein
MYAFLGGKIDIDPAQARWVRFETLRQVNPEDAFRVLEVDLSGGVGIQPPLDLLESDLLLVFVERIGTDPRDTYRTLKPGGITSANLALAAFDVHFQACKMGTAGGDLLR